MDFQKLTTAIVNSVLILSAVLYLREKSINRKRFSVEELDVVFDLTESSTEKIPFLKRKAGKISVFLILVNIAVIIAIGFDNVQDAIEALIYVIMVGIYLLMQKSLDNNKSTGIYNDGILSKKGFINWEEIKGIRWRPSDAFENSHDVIIKTTSKTNVNIIVNNEIKNEVEKLIHSKTKLK